MDYDADDLDDGLGGIDLDDGIDDDDANDDNAKNDNADDDDADDDNGNNGGNGEDGEHNACGNGGGKKAKKWPKQTDVRPNGKGSVNITHRKNRAVRPLLRMAIDAVTQKCLTVDSYPEIPHKLRYLKQVLLKCAADLGEDAIAKRIKDDNDYFLLLRTVVGVRPMYMNCPNVVFSPRIGLLAYAERSRSR